MQRLYLKYLATHNLRPNFWCSDEYFSNAEFVEHIEGNMIWVEGDGVQLFPAIDINEGMIPTFYKDQIWSDFPGHPIVGDKEFLDYEFIFDPNHFLNMTGGNWAVFRKNVRKFPKEKDLTYNRLGDADEAMGLFLNWLANRNEEEEISDDQVIQNYLTHSDNCKFLRDEETVYGINIWDENHKYINFRFCFCQNIPFLSEYMRWLFYTDKELHKGKLVNDGGTLGSESLKQFKLKMNPIQVREVFSWKKR